MDEIYFGNWLRDYSQIIDPALVRPSTGGSTAKGFTRGTLTRVVDVLARSEFGDKSTFEVTTDRLGVYRPEEHIDNPHGIEAHPDKDKAFRSKCLDSEVQVDLKTGLLNYIATRNPAWKTSSEYLEQELRMAARSGAGFEGRRRLGQGLHTLEDFFSHSNFAELLLRKIGKTQVYPWAHQMVEAPTLRYPLVTGKFGPNDIKISGAYLISEHLEKEKECIPGDRSTSAKIMLILLRDIPPSKLNPKWVDKLESLMKFKENAERKVPGLVKIICEIKNILSALPHRILAAQAKKYAKKTTRAQDEFLKNPFSNNPTHSQLAKDHDDHPLHILTAGMAKGAVKEVGYLMSEYWKKSTSTTEEDIVQAALKYIVHPEDIQNLGANHWMVQMTTEWADKNAKLLTLLAKDAIIDRQFMEAKGHTSMQLPPEYSESPENLLAKLNTTFSSKEFQQA